MKKRFSLLYNIALTGSAVLIFFCLLELSLALFWPHKIVPSMLYERNYFCQYHPLLGWINKPDYENSVTTTKGFSFHITHNARGLRGREYPYERTPGKYRILVLGDSFAWGFGVGDSEVFTQTLESITPDVEVINMGVSGYGTDQELLLYTEEGYKYKPDLVVLTFFNNDLDEISTSISYGYPKPYFLADSQPLTVSNVPVPRTQDTERKLFGNPSTFIGKCKKFLRQNTHTYPFLAQRISSLPWMKKVLLATGLADDPFIKGGLPYHTLGTLESSWELFFRLAKEFKSIAGVNKSAFLLVHIPIKELPPQNGFDPVKQNDANSTILRDFSSAVKIDFIDMLPALRADDTRGLRYFDKPEQDIHLNAAGHNLLAHLISEWLRMKDKHVR